MTMALPSRGSAQTADDREISKFQKPSEERAVEGPSPEQQAEGGAGDAGDGGSSKEVPTTRLEQRMYLREQPDTLGASRREIQNETIDKMLEKRERLVRVRRKQAIELLEEFIRQEPQGAPQMPDALLRLAELRWEKARADYLEAFGAWQEVPKKHRGPRPRPKYGPAMELYDRILENYPDYPRYDLVLYMKAFALLERKEKGRALKLYRRIIDEFPESKFVPDAHFALAEAAFTGRYDYRAALKQYEKVLDYPESELADLALFKSAWCLWRLGRDKQAATRFRKVLDLSRERSGVSAEHRRRLQDLQDEALSYLIQVFTEDEENTAKDVFDFLDEIGGEKYAYRVLERLSETYMGQARFRRAVEAYRLLLEMKPNVAEAPEYQHEIASAHAEMGVEAKTFESLRKLASNYAPGSEWAKAQADPKVVEDARKLAERALRRQALEYHERGQEEEQLDELKNAARLYRVYLEHFPEGKKAYRLQFYLAEILFHRLEDYDEAGGAYLAAARRKPKGELTRDALYNAIGAFERVREKELEKCVEEREQGDESGPDDADTKGESSEDEQPSGSEKASASKGPPKCGETENDKKFSQAIELYVELYPNDPDLPEILFRQGRLYYDRGIYDPAVRLFGQLLSRYPKSEYAEPAGELILDSFNQAEDYANIEKWARRLKDAPAFQSAKKQRRLNKLIVKSMFKRGEQLAEQDKHTKAANLYFKTAEEFPENERAAKAYYNAGLERQRGGDLPGAAEAYDRLIEKHPKTEVGARGAWKAAQMYESIAQFRDAAQYYEKYARRFPRGKKRVDALYNAVLLRVTAGDEDAAVEAGKAFLRRHPRHEAADNVYFFIGRAHEAAGRWRQAARTYKRYVRRSRNLDRKVEAQTRLAEVLLEADRQGAAERALKQAVELGKEHKDKLADGLYYAAKARYLQGQLVLDDYESIQIKGPVEGLRKRLERKSKLLKEASLIYADVVEFDVAEWVTAALYQIGRSYELFANAMREAPIPEGLSSKEEQSYRSQLARFIVPMEERALDSYKGGYEKALELNIYNQWTRKLRKSLTRLNEIQYPPLRETGGSIVEVTPLPKPQPMQDLEPREATEGGR
jgi:TolA-binding protein